MNNTQKVIDYLVSISPERATNREIVKATKIRPHQQVFQITAKLFKSSEIKGVKIGNEWSFWFDDKVQQVQKQKPVITQKINRGISNSSEFEHFARQMFEKKFGVKLYEKEVNNVRKRFDFVSKDEQIIGDAKYYTMVKGERLPPAKFSVIAEHVWLLEKTKAKTKFLVFGNDSRVPTIWLDKYGKLVTGVKFYFINNSSNLVELN